jgi:hypothetical protein
MNRRNLLASIGALGLTPQFAWAEDYIDIGWKDLLPDGTAMIPPMLQGLIAHDQAPLSSQQPESNGVRTDWNGQIVRLPGFIVPIDYSGTGVTAFILVPFVGACVHVPPPPANQLVFVTTPEPYESSGMFEPVNVIGMFGVSSLSTQLADIAYALSADRIEPYRA